MEWPKLLSYRRLGKTQSDDYDPARPPWQKDYDRIIFSSAFRRMQDKTQVFPLSGSDYVRTRLTHSLEVSTVARTMGTMVGKVILDQHGHEAFTKKGENLKTVLSPSDIGTITATGALAHDIGNPPFGHSGEDAIRYWFKHSKVTESIEPFLTPQQKLDFVDWEGNAAGFRILTRLQMARNNGGFQLTAASLGAYTKYPTAAGATDKGMLSAKKPGVFQQDVELWKEVAAELGLIQSSSHERWCRHPLAYLTEAADDICYRIIDLEDGYRLGRVSYDEVRDLFTTAAGKEAEGKMPTIFPEDELEHITHLRALAISAAIKQSVAVFLDNESLLLEGKFEGDIVGKIPASQALKDMQNLGIKRVYTTPSVVHIEAAGYDIIFGLLEAFAFSVENVARDIGLPKDQQECCSRSKKLLELMPTSFIGPSRIPDPDPYVRLLGVVDFVAGMTDTFALTLNRRITGVSLPT